MALVREGGIKHIYWFWLARGAADIEEGAQTAPHLGR